MRELVKECTCPTQFPMVYVSDGRYRIGDSKYLIFVRVGAHRIRDQRRASNFQILRHHVMVRVGGGWDTLQNFLDKHDPCRHRAASDASMITKDGQGPMAAKVVYNRYIERLLSRIRTFQLCASAIE